jgi:methylenetetrahydrofolate dehydrogenase (NADP+)/methenyltetrahydrofolate cyclohydrolase
MTTTETTGARILDGAALARRLRREIGAGVEALLAEGGRPPGLAVILVGADPASRLYVGSKQRAAASAGRVSRVHERPVDVSQGELERLVDELNADATVDGFLVQLPLPAGLDADRLLERIDPAKDVDGFHPINVGRLWLGGGGFAPATPAGIIALLARSDIELAGRHAVVVGRSRIVGKPLAALLLRENCTVTIAHSRTRDLPGVCRSADLLVAAIGAAGFFGRQHVSPGTVVVDVGVNRVSEVSELERLFPDDEARRRRFEERGYILAGDVDFRAVAPIVDAITPVPGGVGPLTVTMLLSNTLEAARRRLGRH